ncbi:hypothetical protein EN794_051305 [Mesorhizobium sp. M00.F.Ca.ET.151.01.1.1]|nr:hypothetical protein EN851_00045 [Mesorhizobium sp. M8A.F.Ca.ET.208.01.1.1]TGT54511.1 hypothetical protein EN810_00045 [Mesorhizobium sp. M8A.F.Ca.ET.167.01.1.1]TGU87401.1 hypothetical protein EN794_051305 [Mesorhizobium sp. M00.F.Ca.ET.151.01.1.1]
MAALKHHSIGWGSCFFSKLRQKHCASAGTTGCRRPGIWLDPGATNSPTITPGGMNSNADQNCPTSAQTDANGRATAPTVNDKNCGT